MKNPLVRFTRYASLSLVTVPAAYGLFVLARHLFDVNAGLLNLGVGIVLTPPSYLLYRHLVWKDRDGRGFLAGLFSFWQTVMAGALASSALMALLDLVSEAGNAMLIAAGLTGQAVIFLARFLWLDRVTFVPRLAVPVEPVQDYPRRSGVPRPEHRTREERTSG